MNKLIGQIMMRLMACLKDPIVGHCRSLSSTIVVSCRLQSLSDVVHRQCQSLLSVVVHSHHPHLWSTIIIHNYRPVVVHSRLQLPSVVIHSHCQLSSTVIVSHHPVVVSHHPVVVSHHPVVVSCHPQSSSVVIHSRLRSLSVIISPCQSLPVFVSHRR